MYLYALYFVSSTSVVNWWSAQGAAWTLWPIFHMECKEKWGWLVNAKQASQIFTPAIKKYATIGYCYPVYKGAISVVRFWLLLQASKSGLVQNISLPSIDVLQKKYIPALQNVSKSSICITVICFFSGYPLPANCRLQFKSCVHKLDVISILNTIGYNKASRYLLFSIWFPCHFGVVKTSSVHICIFWHRGCRFFRV